jgi:branched-subunit amino acid aminotransferase/4-amino-4-deoxychorismate lyase
MIWRDGELVEDTPLCVPPADVEGVMTTAGCDASRVLLWERHRHRLVSFTGFRVEDGILPKVRDLELLLEISGCTGPSRLRGVIWRDGPSSSLRVEVSCGVLRGFGPTQDPIWLGVVRDSAPPNAGQKIVARHTWRDAQRLAVSWGADDALMADGEGRLLETSKANIFVRRGLVVATPPAPVRCLPGIMRHVVIGVLPRFGLKVEERDVFIDELEFADEVWVTNAVRGVVRVGRVGERSWDHWPFHRRLARLGIPAPGW